MIQDATVPSGERHVHYGQAWDDLSRLTTCEAAKGRCEGCENAHSLPWPRGDAHHRLGRGAGGAWREDRCWVPMFRPSETNLARMRWFRGLLWTCRTGHERLERLSTAEYRQGLNQFCSCGLLLIEKVPSVDSK